MDPDFSVDGSYVTENAEDLAGQAQLSFLAKDFYFSSEDVMDPEQICDDVLDEIVERVLANAPVEEPPKDNVKTRERQPLTRKSKSKKTKQGQSDEKETVPQTEEEQTLDDAKTGPVDSTVDEETDQENEELEEEESEETSESDADSEDKKQMYDTSHIEIPSFLEEPPSNKDSDFFAFLLNNADGVHTPKQTNKNDSTSIEEKSAEDQPTTETVKEESAIFFPHKPFSAYIRNLTAETSSLLSTLSATFDMTSSLKEMSEILKTMDEARDSVISKRKEMKRINSHLNESKHNQFNSTLTPKTSTPHKHSNRAQQEKQIFDDFDEHDAMTPAHDYHDDPLSNTTASQKKKTRKDLTFSERLGVGLTPTANRQPTGTTPLSVKTRTLRAREAKKTNDEKTAVEYTDLPTRPSEVVFVNQNTSPGRRPNQKSTVSESPFSSHNHKHEARDLGVIKTPASIAPRPKDEGGKKKKKKKRPSTLYPHGDESDSPRIQSAHDHRGSQHAYSPHESPNLSSGSPRLSALRAAGKSRTVQFDVEDSESEWETEASEEEDSVESHLRLSPDSADFVLIALDGTEYELSLELAPHYQIADPVKPRKYETEVDASVLSPIIGFVNAYLGGEFGEDNADALAIEQTKRNTRLEGTTMSSGTKRQKTRIISPHKTLKQSQLDGRKADDEEDRQLFPLLYPELDQMINSVAQDAEEDAFDVDSILNAGLSLMCTPVLLYTLSHLLSTASFSQEEPEQSLTDEQKGALEKALRYVGDCIFFESLDLSEFFEMIRDNALLVSRELEDVLWFVRYYQYQQSQNAKNALSLSFEDYSSKHSHWKQICAEALFTHTLHTSLDPLVAEVYQAAQQNAFNEQAAPSESPGSPLGQSFRETPQHPQLALPNTFSQQRTSSSPKTTGSPRAPSLRSAQLANKQATQQQIVTKIESAIQFFFRPFLPTTFTPAHATAGRGLFQPYAEKECKEALAKKKDTQPPATGNHSFLSDLPSHFSTPRTTPGQGMIAQPGLGLGEFIEELDLKDVQSVYCLYAISLCCPRVRVIDAQGVKCVSVPTLIRLIRTCKNLEEVDLRNTQIDPTDEQIHALLNAHSPLRLIL
ncbi:hypothetical protein BLNAU_3672 [Blattamonas nauphoetae]|uniref:Uncharacterized protein n=1 Tax=Blattamonas nauphoetae TaxID=2049346 RepID=A0ABQ9YBS6_9EUKA|nr:hypothetical protein BLNAU_3672 [Blattamonas nauphoetae]